MTASTAPGAPCIFDVLIPARLASTRLPNKPLADLSGLPMVVRVAQRAQASGARQVVIATDAPAICAAAEQHGLTALLTRSDHPTGTDRLAQAADLLALPDSAIVVNVQGDEPLIDPRLIRAVAQQLANHPDCALATAAHPLTSPDDYHSPHVVKVVCTARGTALYFSRAAIPWARDALGQSPPENATRDYLAQRQVLRHIGLYAYRVSFLRAYPQLSPSPLEAAESLEQLRALWHGHAISVLITDTAPAPGVDTPADLARVRQLLE